MPENTGMHRPEKGPPRRRRRARRLSLWEIIVMAVGYGTLLYLLLRGLVYGAVLLAR